MVKSARQLSGRGPDTSIAVVERWHLQRHEVVCEACHWSSNWRLRQLHISLITVV